MALILNIETATQVCGVSLSKDGEIEFCEETTAGMNHASSLIGMIEKAATTSGKNLAEIDAIACSAGPGSYTGLRVGYSTAKGLCLALKKPLIAIPTLQSLAYGMSDISNDTNLMFCPMIDARRMEVYCALYDYQLNLVGAAKPLVITADSFNELLADGKIVFGGDGALKASQVIHHPNAIFKSEIICSARYMGKLAEQKFQSSEFERLDFSEPIYLKQASISISKK